MTKPLVSIIIPCYNAAPWLQGTLESIRSQTWKHHETILVDDGSTDNSLEIAKSFSGITMKVVSQKNAGPSAALNHALKYAQGDYIEYLDADDLLEPEKLSVQLRRAAELCDRTVLSGEWVRFYKQPGERPFVPEALWADFEPQDWVMTAWLRNEMMHGAAWLIPHKLVQEAGPWCEDLTLLNDFEYYPRLLLRSEKICFCAGARTYYRSGMPGSVSARKGPVAWQSAYNAFTRGTEHLLQRNRSPRALLASATVFQHLAYMAWPESPDLVRRAEELVEKYGGCDLPLRAGFIFNCLVRTLGWKPARRLQYLLHKRRAEKTSGRQSS